MLPNTVFSRPVSAWLVAAVCFLCYIVGRKTQMYINRSDLGRNGAAQGIGSMQSSSGSTVPGPLEFDLMLQHSGFTNLRPPVTPGQSGMHTYTLQPFQVLSWHPRAILFPNFIDLARCDHIIALASARMEASGLALRAGETKESTANIRTSYGTFVAASQDPDGVLAWLEERIAMVTGLPVSHGEAFNVLRYTPGQKYDSHYDTFDPAQYGAQGSQRVATVLVYLSSPEEGGETVFKLEGEGNTVVSDYTSCDKGLKYKPRRGDALLFWSVLPDGGLDKHSLHGGCPVGKGVKWDATKWIHNKPVR